MQYRHVCIESLGYTVPGEIITSDEIERRLEPLYRRLKLPAGRLELMSGIRERRLWPRGTRPSDKSIDSGHQAIEAARIDPAEIGCLIRSGLVVGTEDSRALLESTIEELNRDQSLTRESVKPAFASLTIGSASAA